MDLAIFDLDNTLIAGDSDYLWGQFLVEQHRVDGEEYERENARFYHLYKEGGLDIWEYLRFCLRPLASHELGELRQWRQEFIELKIKPILLPKAIELIESHRRLGHTLLIITATNRFVTEPIAEILNIPNLLATEPELINNRYTGEVAGTPCFQTGKVTRLEEWLTERTGFNLDRAWFYSDSHNDLPLLRKVGHAVAVDADSTLQKYAQEVGWPVISLR